MYELWDYYKYDGEKNKASKVEGKYGGSGLGVPHLPQSLTVIRCTKWEMTLESDCCVAIYITGNMRWID